MSGRVLGVAVHKRKKTVIVGRTSFSLQAGAAKTVTVKLNANGRKLLKRFKRLPVKLSVKYAAGGKTLKLPVKKLTLKQKRRR